MEKVAELELQLEEALKKALKEDRLDREKAFKLFGYKLVRLRQAVKLAWFDA